MVTIEPLHRPTITAIQYKGEDIECFAKSEFGHAVKVAMYVEMILLELNDWVVFFDDRPMLVLKDDEFQLTYRVI